MAQQVTLSMEGRTATVIVEEAHLSDERARFTGFDPSFCPDGMADGIRFFSKDLTAIITPESAVTVERVEPTDDPVPDPEVFY